MALTAWAGPRATATAGTMIDEKLPRDFVAQHDFHFDPCALIKIYSFVDAKTHSAKLIANEGYSIKEETL